jgi:hypothetical protein
MSNSKAERVVDTLVPSVGALKPADTRSLEPDAVGQIAMTAGMGATAGYVLYSWLFGPEGVTHWTKARAATELLGISLSVFFVMRYWEPWIARMRAAAGHPERPHSVHILRLRLQGLMAIVLIIVGNEVLQHMAREEARDAAVSFISPFLITYAWVLGAQQRPSRAAFFGTLTALLLGIGVFWEGVTSLGISLGELPTMVDVRFILYLAGLTVLDAFLVGLAIDRRWGRRVQWTAVLIVVGAQLFLGTILLPLIEARFLHSGQFDWRGAVLGLMKAMGWGLGLALFTPTDMALNHPERGPEPWAVARGRPLKVILTAALIVVLALIYPATKYIWDAAKKQEAVARTQIELLSPTQVDEAIAFGNNRSLAASEIVDEGSAYRMEFKDFGFAIIFTPWLAVANEAHGFRVRNGGQFATAASINANAIVNQNAGTLGIVVLGRGTQKDFWMAADGYIRQGTTTIRPIAFRAENLGPVDCTGPNFGCYEAVITFTFPTEGLDRKRPADFTMVIRGKRYRSTVNLPELQ